MGTLTTIFVLLLLLLAGILLQDSFVQIPTAYFGVVLRFGKRTGRVVFEGIRVKLPYIEEVRLINEQLTTIPVEATCLTRDNLQLTIFGSLQWAPSPKVSDQSGRNQFLAIDESTIPTGIQDAVESELGKLGSLEAAESFILNRESLERFLSCMLRFARPPHELDNLEPSKWISYYVTNRNTIVERLRSLSKTSSKDFSLVEKRYGIEIVAFYLTNITFSEATRIALEKKGQTTAALLATDEQMQRINLYATRLQNDHGLNADSAVNTAKVLLGLAQNKIISIEGLDKLGLAALLDALRK
jgi:regulator of protease activity HflC (stomatin/prohibitin superfamily)